MKFIIILLLVTFVVISAKDTSTSSPKKEHKGKEHKGKEDKGKENGEDKKKDEETDSDDDVEDSGSDEEIKFSLGLSHNIPLEQQMNALYSLERVYERLGNDDTRAQVIAESFKKFRNKDCEWNVLPGSGTGRNRYKRTISGNRNGYMEILVDNTKKGDAKSFYIFSTDASGFLKTCMIRS